MNNALRAWLIWTALLLAMLLPILIAAFSPFLAWRQPVYIVAGFAGILAMTLLLVQPLLAGRYLPGLKPSQSRQIHRLSGGLLIVLILSHVGGLWLTSPPDVIDALVFNSPTPFSAWGVVAMWAALAAALIVVLRRRIRPAVWRLCHALLVSVTVVGTAVHAWLIEGTMGTISKAVLSILVLAATAKVLVDLRIWKVRRRRAS